MSPRSVSSPAVVQRGISAPVAAARAARRQSASGNDGDAKTKPNDGCAPPSCPSAARIASAVAVAPSAEVACPEPVTFFIWPPRDETSFTHSNTESGASSSLQVCAGARRPRRTPAASDEDAGALVEALVEHRLDDRLHFLH